MLNEESRKYFNRAFLISGSAFQYYVWHRGNHIEYIQKCSGSNETDQMIEYLKTTNSSNLVNCRVVGKSPTIEIAGTKGAFLSQNLEDIYNSDEAPAMDTMFCFSSQVNI